MNKKTTTRKPIDDRTQGELIRLLYQQSPVLMVGIATLIVATTWFLWGDVSRNVLITWCAANVVLTAARIVIIAVYRQSETTLNRQAWGWLSVVTSGTSGFLWGSLALWALNPESAANVVFIVTVLTSMTSASLVALSSWLRSYFAYATVSVSMLAIGLSQVGQTAFTLLALLILVFLFVNLFFSIIIHRNIRETLRLRFENLELVDNLRRQKEIAVEANRNKSKFLAAASHDLRQPLHALGLLIPAAASSEDEAERSRLFSKIDSSTDALRGLFDALLDISKLDAGVVDVDKVHFSFNDLAARLSEELRPGMQGKNLELVFGDLDVVLHTDPVLLERIVRNLLNNAVKFTTEGEVGLFAETGGDTIQLNISDSGPGIPPEFQGRIFHEFEQLGNAERDRRKGFGLGLAIVKRLCRLLDLPLKLESTEGVGTTFCLSIPKGRTELVASQTADYAQPKWDVENCRVLVIDDEEDVADATAALLRTWGCNTRCANHESEAVDCIADQQWRPDIILVDYRLRDGQTGTELIQIIRDKLGCDVPAVILTGDTAAERLVEVAASGLMLLHKPVKPANLRAAMNMALIGSS